MSRNKKFQNPQPSRWGPGPKAAVLTAIIAATAAIVGPSIMYLNTLHQQELARKTSRQDRFQSERDLAQASLAASTNSNATLIARIRALEDNVSDAVKILRRAALGLTSMQSHSHSDNWLEDAVAKAATSPSHQISFDRYGDYGVVMEKFFDFYRPILDIDAEINKQQTRLKLTEAANSYLLGEMDDAQYAVRETLQILESTTQHDPPKP